MFTLHQGDCVEVMASMAEGSIDAIVCDPPYGLEFMGKEWDRPWAVSATNAVGYAGRDDLQLPVHRDNRNANCRSCGGRQRGVKRCTCEVPSWDRNPNTDMVEFQWWCEMWAAEALRVLKPGGHLLAFGGTRTYHRMVCAIEDAGFEIRDSIQWIYGSGFPKSMDVSKAMDKAARGVPQGGPDPTSPHHGEYKTQASEGQRDEGDKGQGYGAGPGQFMKPGDIDPATGRKILAVVANRSPHAQAEGWGNPGTDEWYEGKKGTQPMAVTAPESQEAQDWAGWGTALKPAHEPIVVARKPLVGTVIQNVLVHGTGAINIDATRVSTGDKLGGGAETITTPEQKGNEGWTRPWMEDPEAQEAHAATVRANVAKAEQLGRWPANLVLTHSSACTSEGTAQIKAITGTAAGRMMGKPSAVYGGYPGRSDRAGEATGFGDADGMETVAVWDCAPGCPVAELDRQSGERKAGGKVTGNQTSRTGESGIYGVYERVENSPHHDTGGASRFFPTFAGEAPFLYCAKAARSERNAGLTGPEKPLLWSSGTKSPGTFQSEGTKRAAINNHPTVKPVALMRWLVRLVGGPGAVVLDPFVGSGTTGIAVVQEGFEFVGIDSNPEYLEIARGRITNAEEGMASTLF
jgi:DNA modification methylase